VTPIPGRHSSHGAELLDELADTVRRYVVLPIPEAITAVVLWIAATHGQPAFQHATRLAINSPEKRCGKSRLLDIIEATCYKPLLSVNATVAALFRSIDDQDPPTILLDEADAIWSTKKSGDGSEDLRALINAGFGRGRPVLRCVGPQQTPTAFSSFAMAALAGIGDCLPDTVTDRSVRITMRRRAAREPVQSFRRRRDGDLLHKLRDRLTDWLRAHLEELESAEPESRLEDRAADTWEPLFAIADLAGGAWPGRARDAAMVLAAEAEGEDVAASQAVLLLSDIKDVFTEADTSVLSSEDLVNRLRGLTESPWGTFDLNASKLAYRLKPWKIKPTQVRPDGERQVRGYKLEDFHDTFDRYLPDPPSHSVTASQVQVIPVTPPASVTPQTVTVTQPVTELTCGSDGVTSGDAPFGPGRPPAGCERCELPLDPVLIREGETTHPMCEVAS